MIQQEGFQNFARKDDIGKINLSKQIEICQNALSSKLETQSGDIMRSYKISAKNKMDSVDTLGRMIQFYIKLSPYFKKFIELKKKFKPLMKDKNEHKSTIAKERFAEEKFGLLMEFIALKGWFIEDSAIGTIGSPDEYNMTEDEFRDKYRKMSK